MEERLAHKDGPKGCMRKGSLAGLQGDITSGRMRPWLLGLVT